MAGFLGRAAASLGRKAIAPAIGSGIGFTSTGIKDAFFDDDNEVEGDDYLRNGLLGALMGGGRGVGRGIEGLLGRKLSANVAGKVGGGLGWGLTGGGGLGLLGSLFDGHDEKAGGGAISGLLSPGKIGPVPLPGMGGVDSSASVLEGGPFGSIGAAPVFNKTLDDYMRDPTLASLADAQIIKANAALARENKDTRIEMGRNVRANSDAGTAALDQIGQIRRENSAQNQAVQQNARSDQQRVVQEADKLASDVGASIIADDHTRHDLQAEQAANAQDIAARQAADSKLLERMATASQDNLAGLAGAEALATKSNADSIRAKATDAIAANRAQASDNWLERPNILGSLADTALQRDLQAHQMALQSWGQRLDALNSYRGLQLEQQKLQGAGSQMDPSMLNTMLSLAMKPSGYTKEQVGEDGTKQQYEYPTWQTWDPQVAQMYGGMLQQYFGINPFSTPLNPFGD